MLIKATVCGLLMAGLLSACGQPTDQQQAPRPLDTSMQKPPSADPSQPVSSGNTPTAADIAAAAALNAQYDPSRDPAADLETAKVEAKRGGKRIVLNVGNAACAPCQALDEVMGGDAELRSFRDAHFVVVKVNRDASNENAAFLSQFAQLNDFPSLLVLDNDGKPLTLQAGPELRKGDGYDRKKLFDFLKQWAPPDA
ncbi:thioredoxin family protein [Xanthomonas campestris]|uniref:thioredoxin family protein n=1 Tax=Xanthomonas campestris TaxID=339 RepID=UPI002B23D868|nr:thioredoxin family protein [Xanthomonas campestris]MEA9772500.1 thioredoxin family protein [Xanthomonas campestris pv. raphani]MEA9799826.1 thioredoxin family protein [Xanthomonas campestris pv. raphani]MEA9834042.1 thioredoxin family protein [Xanthomonas campestris pv. raphani]MEA9922427.1 thioredoxin family protein [Xanthomonas campestris pv. raphani]MEA9951051.1 thioredoxin family protein [Xanthomonas campestris pv. raphani]